VAARYLSGRDSGVILGGESLCVAVSIGQADCATMQEVFIVDDDPSVRAALAVVLNDAGFEVTSFVEGEAFLSAARARIPQCVLIDIHLPGCSGFDILRRLDALHYPAPVLIISGRGDIPTAIDAIRNGALDFIEKPFDPAAVATRVRDTIEAWQNLNRDDSILCRDFPGTTGSPHASGTCWSGSPAVRQTRKPDASSASHHAPSKCTARGSWKNSSPRMPPI
jgi:DNA-binding NtrC family response regulator